jgi:hypothetical protein
MVLFQVLSHLHLTDLFYACILQERSNIYWEWQPLLVADSGTGVLCMSACASLCKRQPTIILAYLAPK